MPDDYDTMHATQQVVAAYVQNNPVSLNELPNLIEVVHAKFATLANGHIAIAPAPEPVALTPAVPIKKSVRRDHIVCLDDGKKLQTLKRHLGRLGLTPEQYRQKWGLPPDYPMVAPAYSERRSALAKEVGLGVIRRSR